MEPATSLLIGEAAKVLLEIVPKLVDTFSELSKRRESRKQAQQSLDDLGKMRESVSAIGFGLDSYIQAIRELNNIEAECKTLRDFLDENPSLPAGSGKWTTVNYLLKAIQDRSLYYDTLIRNPQGLFEKDDLHRVDFVIGDYRESLNKSEIFSRQKLAGELLDQARIMVQKAGKISQVFQERIDTTLLALKKA
jgi:hypothetical protein